MPKRDVEHFVAKIFASKAADDHRRTEKGEDCLDMQEYFFQFLQKEYTTQIVIAEVAYNLLDGCRRYNHDADIEIFSKVMNGLLSEKVVQQQRPIAHAAGGELGVRVHADAQHGTVGEQRVENAHLQDVRPKRKNFNPKA